MHPTCRRRPLHRQAQTLLRFLRGRDGNVPRAEKMFRDPFRPISGLGSIEIARFPSISLAFQRSSAPKGPFSRVRGRTCWIGGTDLTSRGRCTPGAGNWSVDGQCARGFARQGLMPLSMRTWPFPCVCGRFLLVFHGFGMVFDGLDLLLIGF